MIDSRYLAAGLNAMARAHHVNPMAGHLGAAVVAGCFFSEQCPELDARVYRGIEGSLDQILRGDSVFSPGESAQLTTANMFEPFRADEPTGGQVDSIAEALSGNIEQTRQSGHNVIFASIAIRAFKDHPELATPSVIEGVRKLISGFDGASPGSGYYGKEKGRIDGREVPVPNSGDFPPYTDIGMMAEVVIDRMIQHASERRTGFGGLVHVINHAAALAELARYGYPELAASGLPAHHHHVQLWQTLPDVAHELGPEIPAQHDPHTAAFWRTTDLRPERAQLTHRIKTLYGFQALIELVKDESRCRRAHDVLRYLI